MRVPAPREQFNGPRNCGWEQQPQWSVIDHSIVVRWLTFQGRVCRLPHRIRFPVLKAPVAQRDYSRGRLQCVLASKILKHEKHLVRASLESVLFASTIFYFLQAQTIGHRYLLIYFEVANLSNAGVYLPTVASAEILSPTRD